MSDKDIEQEIQAKGLTAPRVTSQHIQSLIVGEYYFTAADGVQQSLHKQDDLTRLCGAHLNWTYSLSAFWCSRMASLLLVKAPAPARKTLTRR